MNPLEELKRTWISAPFDKEAALELWDNQAKQNCYTKIPSFENNKFLQLLKKEQMLDESFDVLDIGCGGGAYSIAMSPFVHQIIGCDLSKEMIENAKKLSNGIDNVSWQVKDWHNISIEEEKWTKKFDLSFAHMSPAIQDVTSLEKLIQTSRNYCVVTKPTRRTDSVLDIVKKMVGFKETRTDLDNDIRQIFNYTWLSGYQPKLMYENQEWLAVRTIEEAFIHYTSRIRQFIELSKEETDKIYQYLLSIANDGKVEEIIKSLTVTIYWSVNLTI